MGRAVLYFCMARVVFLLKLAYISFSSTSTINIGVLN